LFLNIPFKGRGFTRAALLIPWVVPGAAIAIMWRSMVDYNYGIVNDLLVRIGLIPGPVAWIGEADPAFWIIVSASYWASTPFVTLTLLAVLQSISPELYEAAKVDGASSLDRFRFITFPMLLPTILLLFLLRTIGLAHGIDFIYLISMGGPGYSNYTLAVYSFLLTNRLQIGYPAAIAIILGVVLVGLSALYLYLIEKSKEWM
jgi:multiple sugar transport system permease protein